VEIIPRATAAGTMIVCAACPKQIYETDAAQADER
jgi:hypothetical protein